MKPLECLTTTRASDLHRARDFADHTVWSRLFEKYNESMRTVCRGFGVPQHEVDDVVQNVWCELSLKLEDFSYDPGQRFRGYLFWLCKRRSLDRLGGLKRLRLRFVDLSSLVALIDDREDEVPIEFQERLELIAELQQAVRSDFDADTWTAFHSISVENQPRREVAAKLGKKSTTVSRANQRVKARLREELARRLAKPL